MAYAMFDRSDLALSRLEAAVAASRGGKPKSAGIRRGLHALRDALICSWPTSTDPYAQLCQDAPRLAGAVRSLETEREQLAQQLDGLLAHISGIPAENLAQSVRPLLGEVRKYQKRGADLLHQAYTVDLGGEM